VFDFLNSVGTAYEGTCVGYDPTFLSKFVAGLDYYPVFLTFVMVLFSATQFEVYYWLLTSVLFIDLPLNYGLQQLIGPVDNIQPPQCLPRQTQMPAAGIEQITVLWVVGWGMAHIIYPRRVRPSMVALYTAFVSLALYTRIYLIFNSTAQLLVGMAIGLGEGIAYLMVLAVLRNSGTDKVIIRLLVSIFRSTIDTMIYPDDPTIHIGHNVKNVHLVVATQ